MAAGFVGIFIAVLMILLGVLLKYGKAYGLIAGYNTMSKDKQKNVDVVGLADYMFRWFTALGLVVLTGSLISFLGYPSAFVISIAVFVPGIVFMVVRAQRFDHNVKGMGERKSLFIAIAVTSLITVGIAGMLVYGGMSTQVEPARDGIVIKGMYGTTIPADEIVDIFLSNELPRIITRNNGLGAGAVRKGHFTLEDLGRGRLYIESDEGPFIFIMTADSYVIINYRDGADTEALYRAIVDIVGEISPAPASCPFGEA